MMIDKKTKLPDHLHVDWIDDTTFKSHEDGQSQPAKQRRYWG